MGYVIKKPKGTTSGLTIETLDNGDLSFINVYKDASKRKEWKSFDLAPAEEAKLLEYLLKRKEPVTKLPDYATIRRSLYLSERTEYTGVIEPVKLGLVREPLNGEYIPVVFFQDGDDTQFHRDFDTMEAAIAFIEAAPNPLTDKWLDDVFYGTEWG